MKARVPVWGKPQGFVTVDPEATKGAVVGADLYWPDGTLVQETDLRTAAQAPSGVSTTIWRLVMEIPANVKALEYASGTGLFAVTGAGSGAMRSLQAGAGISISNGSGVSGNPTVTNTDTGSAAVASHVAAGDPHPQYALDAHTHALSDLAQSGATSGQVPQWNGSTWIPATVASLLTLQASGAVSALRAIVADGGTGRYPNTAIASDAGKVVGISVTAAADGKPFEVLTDGEWTDASWSWTPGPVFCGADGVLTQTPPSGWVLEVGRALSATRLIVDVKTPLVRA